MVPPAIPCVPSTLRTSIRPPCASMIRCTIARPSPVPVARVVKNGQSDEWGAFTCLSEQTGFTCTVIGGKATGKGFAIDAAGITAVSP